METQVYFYTIWVYMFLSIFLCFCVRYKVFSVCCTLSKTEKSSVNKEDFRFKWDLMWQKPFLNFLKLNFNSIQFGSIHSKPFFGVVVPFY